MLADLRFALRMLRRSPGFTLVVILSLALGIGANTAIFSLAYQVILRSLPVKDPTTLVSLRSNDYSVGWTRNDNNITVFSYPMYQALRDRNQVFTGLFGRASFPATLIYRGNAARSRAEVVTGNFFEVLGLKPALGRLLIPADDAPRQSPVVVLSYSYWAGRLGADPNVLNTQIRVNGQPALVVGVAPRGFRSLLSENSPGVFAPVSMVRLIWAGWERDQLPSSYWLNLFGRLRPGTSERQAQARLEPLFRSTLREELPLFKDLDPEARRRMLAKPLTLAPAAQGLNQLRDQWQTPLLALLVMVGLVLLICCANIANLQIARAAARQREIAVRLAVGATRGQLFRQLMVESLVLAVAGGLLGLLISQGLAQGLLSLLPSGATGGWLSARLDMRLLWFSLALSIVTGFVFGLIPALQASKPEIMPALKEESTGMSASSSQARIRKALVIAQICLSLVLLIGAGLFSRSLLNLIHTDPGFRADQLITFSIDPSLSGYTQERSIDVFREIQQRLESLPGIESVARAELGPFGGVGWGNGLSIPGRRIQGKENIYGGQNAVSPSYFRTLGIPLIAGREFTAADNNRSPLVIILNQTFARTLFPNESAVGRHVRMGDTQADAEIVGVVKDSKYGDLREKPDPFFYQPYDQARLEASRQSVFFLRSQDSERKLFTSVRRLVQQLVPDVPIQNLSSMQSMIRDSIYTDRLMAALTIAFGLLAAILAAVGLYGTISYSVTRRTQEFGIRMALGAIPQTIMQFVLGEAGRLIVIGAALALPTAYVLARLVESQLFGIRAYDPTVLIGATFLIAVVTALAAFVPAWRAAQVSPMVAIRNDPYAAWQHTPRVAEFVSRSSETGAAEALLLSEIVDASRHADSFAEAIQTALSTLREKTRASSILLLAHETAEQGYRYLAATPQDHGKECLLPANGLLVSRLRNYSSALPVTREDLETWNRWASERAPQHLPEIRVLQDLDVGLAVALTAKADVLGLLLLGKPIDREAYGALERKILRSVAAQLALLVENARLTDRVVEQERLRRELLLAAEVQRRLFPEGSPQTAVVQLAGICMPARGVGGDYYDFLELGGQQIGIALADVAGKGIAAALIMSVVQASLRSLAENDGMSLAELAGKMNRLLHRSTSANSYATFFYAQVDEGTRQLRYVNAGHNPPFLLRNGNPPVSIEELAVGGIIIGMFAQSNYEEAVLHLQSGDVLLVFTDGVTEAHNPDEDEFGEERLKDALRRAAHLPVDAMASSILEELKIWMGGAAQYDDLTFVVMKVQ